MFIQVPGMNRRGAASAFLFQPTPIQRGEEITVVIEKILYVNILPNFKYKTK